MIDRTENELLDAYERGADLLHEVLEGMGSEQLRARPIPGLMSSMEVACHIVDSDQFMCDRMKRIIATDMPLLIGVESAAYPGPLRYHERDIHLDLQLLAVQRAQMAADLRKLPSAAWSRAAVHSENGRITLFDAFEHAVEHLESHVERIREKRAALGI